MADGCAQSTPKRNCALNAAGLTAVQLASCDAYSDESFSATDRCVIVIASLFGLRDEARQTTATRSYAALLGGVARIPAIGRIFARTELCQRK